MRSFRRPALILLALTALTAVVIGLLWATNVFGWRAFRLVDVETFIGAKLPTGAVSTQFASNRQFGRIIWLRFDLPADQSAALDAFLTEANLPPLRDQFTPFAAANPQEASLTWWNPYEAQTYRGIHQNANGKIIEVLATGSTVYVRAYTIAAR